MTRAAQPAPATVSVRRFDRSTREVALLAVVKADVAGGDSKSLSNPWAGSASEMNGIVDPPFDMLGLSVLAEQNSELNQCVEAMEVNISGYGWRLKRHPHAVDPALDEPAKAELERFEDFLLYADYDSESLTSLRRKTRRDLELSGNAYWEVVRDDAGEVCAFKHLPSYMMRLRRLDKNSQLVSEQRPTGRGTSRRFRSVNVRKRFRSLVQARMGYDTDEPEFVFFKQYGDPRDMLWQSGEHVTPEMKEKAGGKLTPDMLANEVIHFKLYSARSPYGVPRFIGNLLSIYGGRAAEEINFTTFKNNNVPSMAVLVSNGMLTDGSIDRITQFVETSIQGSDNYSKFLVLEAEGGDEDGEDAGNAKIEIKPLTKEQHTDELFQHYAKNNEDRVRRAFRLPPIFVGKADDYTRATADASRKLADEQVFAPERDEEDHLLNRVLRSMGMLYHSFVTNSPNVTNDQDLIAVLTGAEKAGGTTPRIARMILEDILGRELGGFSPKVDPDIPFSLQMADAVKNKAPANEVGAQVTALKQLGIIEKSGVLGMSSEGTKAGGFEDVVLNVGPQAFLVADGSVDGLLSGAMLNLQGREMLLSDGHDALVKVRFGTRERLSAEKAASAVGLPLTEVLQLYPGQGELYVHSIEARDPLPMPVSYTHPEGEMFATGVLAKLRGNNAATAAESVLNLSGSQLREMTARVKAVQAAAPFRVRAMGRLEAARLGVSSPWQRAAALADALDTPAASWSPEQATLMGLATERVKAAIQPGAAPMDNADIMGLALWGYAHPELLTALGEAEGIIASRQG